MDTLGSDRTRAVARATAAGLLAAFRAAILDCGGLGRCVTVMGFRGAVLCCLPGLVMFTAVLATTVAPGTGCREGLAVQGQCQRNQQYTREGK